MNRKFTVSGEGFRMRCDACERSFQLCRVWIDKLNLPKGFDGRYRVVKVNDLSYGVWDKEIKEEVYRAEVLEL